MIPTKEDPIYQFVRDTGNNPVGIIMGALDGDRMLLGWSMCCPRDQWSRDLGVRIAKNRLAAFENVAYEGYHRRQPLIQSRLMAYVPLMRTRLDRILSADGK